MAYLLWIKCHIYSISKQHPASVSRYMVRDYLTHLAVNRHVSINIQKLVLSALVFLAVKVLNIKVCDLGLELAALDFMVRLAALVPKPRVSLTRFHGIFVPNSKHGMTITPAKRGKGSRKSIDTETAERAPM